MEDKMFERTKDSRLVLNRTSWSEQLSLQVWYLRALDWISWARLSPFVCVERNTQVVSQRPPASLSDHYFTLKKELESVDCRFVDLSICRTWISQPFCVDVLFAFSCLSSGLGWWSTLLLNNGARWGIESLSWTGGPVPHKISQAWHEQSETKWQLVLARFKVQSRVRSSGVKRQRLWRWLSMSLTFVDHFASFVVFVRLVLPGSTHSATESDAIWSGHTQWASNSSLRRRKGEASPKSRLVRWLEEIDVIQ